MRFKNYLLKNKEIKKFQSLQIKLVDNIQINDYRDTIDSIKTKYNVDINIDNFLSEFNNKLKTIYKGKYKFALCLDEGILPDDIKKLTKKQTKDIKIEWYKINDEFAKVQKVFEKHLQHSVGGK